MPRYSADRHLLEPPLVGVLLFVFQNLALIRLYFRTFWGISK